MGIHFCKEVFGGTSHYESYAFVVEEDFDDFTLRRSCRALRRCW